MASCWRHVAPLNPSASSITTIWACPAAAGRAAVCMVSPWTGGRPRRGWRESHKRSPRLAHAEGRSSECACRHRPRPTGRSCRGRRRYGSVVLAVTASAVFEMRPSTCDQGRRLGRRDGRRRRASSTVARPEARCGGHRTPHGCSGVAPASALGAAGAFRPGRQVGRRRQGPLHPLAAQTPSP